MSYTASKLGIFALVAASFLAVPSESHAFLFGWFRRDPCCGTTAYYRPRVSFFRPVRSYYGNCCPTTCCYTPQTCCYQTQVCNVPVTSYYRVSACDPCTGQRVTYLRPTVSYVRQVNYAPTNCCTPTTYYSSSVSSDCCTPTITSQPTLSSGTTSGGAITSGGTSDAPSTFKTEGSSTRGSLKPIPQVEENGSSSLDPPEQKQDRTATAPPRRSWTFRRAVATADEVKPRVIPARHDEPAGPRRLSDGGWRASR